MFRTPAPFESSLKGPRPNFGINPFNAGCARCSPRPPPLYVSECVVVWLYVCAYACVRTRVCVCVMCVVCVSCARMCARACVRVCVCESVRERECCVPPLSEHLNQPCNGLSILASAHAVEVYEEESHCSQ
jgi:hypothetical protein